jgi:putative ABC transport system substrate-binding protein
LVADLVGAKVDLMVAASGGAAVAAKNGTNRIPVVFGMTGAPVAMGLVSSLARPGGNLTGLSTLITETSGKRLELLKEVTPNISRVGILSSSSSSETEASLKDLEPTARSLHVELSVADVRDENGLDSAFSTLHKENVGALIVLTGALLTQHRNEIIQLAAKSRLPAMYGISEFVDVGGLMFYGANLTEIYRRAAIYVDKILKGAKPADLPLNNPLNSNW